MPSQPNESVLSELLQTYDLQIACSQCTTRENEITYSIKKVRHQCNGDLLLARHKGDSRKWKPISRRPEFPNPSKYEVCRFFVVGSGCRKHRNRCTFARSSEEAAVWSFQKRKHVDQNTLLRLIAESRMTAMERAIAIEPGGVEKLLAEFAGAFQELCESCFYSIPQQIAGKRWNNKCMSQVSHVWRPLLVHFHAEGWHKKVFNEIRLPPPHHNPQFCTYVTQGLPCWHGSTRCKFAHSEVEMAVWKAELNGQVNRLELLQLSEKRQAVAPEPVPADPPVEIYCKACLLTFSSQESFIKHCSSLEHAQMISEDTTTEWKHRPPPHQRKQDFVLCARAGTCELGENCIHAHSVEEREEWFMRAKEGREKLQTAEAQGLLSYQDILLKEYRSSSNEVHIMSEQVDGVSVTCDEDLILESEQEESELKWHFQIKSERPLVCVALLKQEPGAFFALHSPAGPCTYARGDQFCTTDMTFDIAVSCKSVNPGFYEQWVVFDFDMRPVLLQKIQVRVGQQSLNEGALEESRPQCLGLERWHSGNRMIIPCLEKTEAEEDLLKEYKPPQLNLQFRPEAEDHMLIMRENYRAKMHCFLYKEELAQEEVVSRLSLQVKVSLNDNIFEPQFGLKMSLPGELFAEVPISYILTPDTTEGYVLRRSIRSAFIAPLPPTNNKVYEAIILHDTSGENKIYLQLSKRCCSDLGLRKNSEHQMEVQFQLNRLQFCEWHQAVDILPAVSIVLPDVTACSVPAHNGEFPKLNAKQKAAMAFIIGDAVGLGPVPPLLIYGPFGTGKTFTLAAATKEIVRQPGTKVLICTHTNSSADLYVKDHFHHYVYRGHPEARPLRIKANKKGVVLIATDDITLQYCLLSEDGQSFQFPDRSKLDSHRVIITTTVMARAFQALKLPPGYFTHILIDEASQMLECAALMPLGLAGKGTRVVLAGDHMQMGGKLFSVEDGQHSDYTLLNRLFHFYQGEKHEIASKSRIIFNENYRSTKEIVDFVSTHFYVGKNDAIKASGNVPPHPQFHPLMFHHVRGTCRLDTTTMSWFNSEEIAEVSETVQHLVSSWPSQWGNLELQKICVLSEGTQVVLIRKELRKRNLSRVTVENIANVQGRQFRVVVMTAVQTRDSLLSSNASTLEFFSEARVLNTAMTRAQSQVIVVGDAAALCYFGKCSKIWKSYIQQCIEKGSAHPRSLDMDYVEQEVKEIARFDRLAEENDSDTESVISCENTNIDDILQELMDDSSEVSYWSSEGQMMKDSQNDNFSEQMKAFYSNSEKRELENLLKKHPKLYKRGEIVTEKANAGYIIPRDNSAMRIILKGRKNMGMTFSGDEVVVEIDQTSAKENVSGKVIGVLKASESSRVFVCTFEDDDNQKQKGESKFATKVMIPINNTVTKIRAICLKKDHNQVPIWRRENNDWKIIRTQTFNEESKRSYVYIVEVVQWKIHCCFPLGKVIDVLPIGTSLDEGLKILDMEFKVDPSPPRSVLHDVEICSQAGTFEKKRKDFCSYLTFTIDPLKSKDLDDAISVRDLNSRYEIGIHISDVASFVTVDSNLDEYAKRCGATYYAPNKEPVYMFPRELSAELWSLLPGKDRRAISLLVEVEKNTDMIVKQELDLSIIRSNRKFYYEEAEDIIGRNYREGVYKFGTLEDCLTVAYHFSRVHRKARLLEDWCYEQPDKDSLPGKRRSHQMVEELMIMFNSFVSDFLISKEISKNLTPLRCQAHPDAEKVKALREKHREIIPMSVHLSYHLGTVQTLLKDFCVLTSTWEELVSAAQRGDFNKITDLIATDDIHPQLLPITSEFRNLLGKAYIIRSNSAPESKVGHYSLQLNSYTQASSPIRRYLDVILQRLLHAALGRTSFQYSPPEIDILCDQFSKKNKRAIDYQNKAELLHYATNLKKQNTQKLAVVVVVEPDGDSFKVSFPFDKVTLSETNPIVYRDLQLEDQPLFDKKMGYMVLTWRRRLYSIENTKTHIELKKLQNGNKGTTLIPQKIWQEIVEAVMKEKWEEVRSVLMSAPLGSYDEEQSKSEPKPSSNKSSEAENIKNGTTLSQSDKIEMEHFVELQLNVKPGDTLQVQMTTEIKRGFMMPAVQLLNVNPKFEVCVEHAHNPITCFSKVAQYPAKRFYESVEEYVQIWKPLCEMESASNAVDESDSIIIEDLRLMWKNITMLEGSFYLPLDCKKEWAIECNLGKCFLCIRKRGLKQLQASDVPDENMDPAFFTWVAHGVTVTAYEPKKPSDNNVVKVDFYISHRSMENIPPCVFQEDTKFTVELIPKLLPDIRKERAVKSLNDANNLVQNIALGMQIPRGNSESGIPKRRIMQCDPLPGLRSLNESQCDAIEQALKNSFTVIQGPPGTGKTVVGVHIVYWFLILNSENPRQITDPEERKKKEVILYCGPSNKSVDVVAEYLLGFANKLKPLRVYSRQMEMLEYPYPGSILQLSRKSLRQERSKPGLRSITLHHRIREPDNPFSQQIKDYDKRIEKKEVLDEEEVEKYKKVVNDARLYELEHHDVILCTCTAASTPNLTNKVSARQILIDECAMATEPQALVPLVGHQPEKIVLLGDHKQLRPIVKNELVRKLGMSRSLFERYMEKAIMLDTQYRMHEDICKFPSMESYNGSLKTAVERKTSVLQTAFNKNTQILFTHILGKERSLVVTTEKGNENSKANMEEVKMAVHFADLLITNGRISPESIAILTPYNAQVAEIKKQLKKKKMHTITVSTITKSQGSEWRYVILSTVRSCPTKEIETEPSKGWLSKYVGFVGDPNQINVGITRAQEGLCIIGNQMLLNCSTAWKHLLNHYRKNNCIINAEDFSIHGKR
ncbi:3'-5' exoribonuclease HELZ2 isoform X2 [Amia ocellicauda]